MFPKPWHYKLLHGFQQQVYRKRTTLQKTCVKTRSGNGALSKRSFFMKSVLSNLPSSDDRMNDVVSNKKWAKCFFVTSQLSPLYLRLWMESSIVINLNMSRLVLLSLNARNMS